MKIVRIQGGLGNQMFQYAFYMALKEKHNNVYCDVDEYKKNNCHNGMELEKLFNIKIKTPPRMILKLYKSKNKILKYFQNTWLLKKYKYEDTLYEKRLIKSKENAYYSGYWQSEKYFLDIEYKIRKVFSFDKKITQENLKLIEEISNKNNTVSIHVRRGDYISHDSLGNLTPVFYYKEGIKYIREKIQNPLFLIFSNDIEWCKKNFDFKEEEVIYIDWNKDENSFMDMYLMSICKNNIIANSSFSWWGAWLNTNTNKIVIAPEKWFRDESKLKYKDIVPEKWIKVRNF